MTKKSMTAYQALSEILKAAAALVVPGVTTIYIDDFIGKQLKKYGAVSADKGYTVEWAKTPWLWHSCININSIIAHGKPGNYALQEGDIVSIDLAIKKGDQCADAALTVNCGMISSRRARLLYYAKQTMYAVIPLFTAGRNTKDIAEAIEYHAMSRGFLVNRRFAGHRIGAQLHMKPNIYNTVEDSHEYATLKAGEIYCLEPMLTNGKDNLGIFIDPDLWTCITNDGQDSAIFEHMIEITNGEPKILTTHFTYMKGQP